jgi:parvulin-like peptidyl-prolyl isomerase
VCETIRQQLATGADFATLANRYGREYNASLGGVLGWVDAKSSYAKEIVDLALGGPVRELSKPTRMDAATRSFGWTNVGGSR